MSHIWEACEIHTKFWLKNVKGRVWFGGSRHRWKNIKKDLKEIMWDNVDSIHVPQERNQWTQQLNFRSLERW
jgi:hypothetical protein